MYGVAEVDAAEMENERGKVKDGGRLSWCRAEVMGGGGTLLAQGVGDASSWCERPLGLVCGRIELRELDVTNDDFVDAV